MACSAIFTMIDNFTLLRDFYHEHADSIDEDRFLFGQIMVRKKDGSRFARSNNRIIKDLVFRSASDFDKKKEEIVEICDTLGARAYVNVNPRSFREVAIEMAGVCLDYIRKGSEVASRSAFSTVCGRLKAPKGYWVIDVDDRETVDDVSKMIPNEALRVPTVNGFHILTRGFDLREVREAWPTVDIHKNNPTLLYF